MVVSVETKQFLVRILKITVHRAYRLLASLPLMPWIITKINCLRNANKHSRCLEIGPGIQRIEGFETLDCRPHWDIDYISDAGKRLPFASNSFNIIYASHILEHIPWYLTEKALTEWVRVLKPDGVLEIWVPDGLKICRVFVDYETTGEDRTLEDGWYRFNPEKDPCKWASGRTFTYGDGTGRTDGPNWHRALFSSRYLKQLFDEVGLTDVE